MNKIVKLITDNFSYKLLAVVIGIFLWFYAHGERSSELILKVPVVINTVPSDYVIVNSPPKDIQLSVSGPSSLIFNYLNTKPAYYINLPNTGPGTYTFDVSPSSFHLPEGVKLRTIYPEDITVMLDQTVSKLIDIGVSITGIPDKSNAIKSIRTNPSRVVITGPSTIINNINAVMTQPINISTFTQDTTVSVPLLTDQYKMVTVNPQIIFVTFKMR